MLPGGNVIRHRVPFVFEYSADDTLADGTGVTWDRS